VKCRSPFLRRNGEADVPAEQQEEEGNSWVSKTNEHKKWSGGSQKEAGQRQKEVKSLTVRAKKRTGGAQDNPVKKI